jgi:cell division septum initiation protein DivIVA
MSKTLRQKDTELREIINSLNEKIREKNKLLDIFKDTINKQESQIHVLSEDHQAQKNINNRLNDQIDGLIKEDKKMFDLNQAQLKIIQDKDKEIESLKTEVKIENANSRAWMNQFSQTNQALIRVVLGEFKAR